MTDSASDRRLTTQPWPAVADLLVAYLEQIGVEYVFGIPGGAIEPLYNALAWSARRGNCRPIVTRHESGAAFMADGYARQTGKLGVCCSTTGPGATNLITGVSVAHENWIPMLVITAQTPLANFGRGAFQDSSCTGVNTVGMFQYCTRYNTLVSHVEQLEPKLTAAIMTALHSPKGPVHLSIPLDVLRARAPVRRPSYSLSNKLNRTSLLDDDAVGQLCDEIERAQSLVLVIGNGCSQSIGTILETALKLNATIVTTPDGKGLVSPYHPLFRGVIGFAGHRTASQALADPSVDLVIAVGTGFGEWSSSSRDTRALLNERLVHVASSEGHLIRSPLARLHVRGDIGTVFERVLARIGPKLEPISDFTATEEPIETNGKRHFQLDDEASYRDSTSVPIKPQWLMYQLPRLFPQSTCYLADTGNSVAWAIHYLHPFDRRIAGRRDAKGGGVRVCLEFSSMGWAISAAVGTAFGGPDKPVVCITGDGAWLMNGHEITVAIQERIPIVFIILNDAALGMVKHGQRITRAEPIGYELPEVDYCAHAKALGAEAYVIRCPQDLLDLDVKALCQRPGPTLLDVRIDREEAPPMSVRFEALGLRE
jgi:acetolactate synthase-1/2/3 large subunit